MSFILRCLNPPATGLCSSRAEGKCNYICDQFTQLGAQSPDRNIYLRFKSTGSWGTIQEVRSSKPLLLASLSPENKTQQKTSTLAFTSQKWDHALYKPEEFLRHRGEKEKSNKACLPLSKEGWSTGVWAGIIWIHGRAKQNKESKEGHIFFPFFWVKMTSSPALGPQTLGSQAFRLWDLCWWPPCSQGFLAPGWINYQLSWFSSLQMAGSRTFGLHN